MLKRNLSGGVVAVILILSLVAILAAGFLYIKDPPRVSPEETLRMMTEHNAKQANKGHAAPK